MSFLSLELNSLQGKCLCFRNSLGLWKFLINNVRLVGFSLVFSRTWAMSYMCGVIVITVYIFFSFY